MLAKVDLTSKGQETTREQAARQLREWGKKDKSIVVDPESIKRYIEAKKVSGKSTLHLKQFKNYRSAKFLEAVEEEYYWKVFKSHVVDGRLKEMPFPESARRDLVDVGGIDEQELEDSGLSFENCWLFHQNENKHLFRGYKVRQVCLRSGSRKVLDAPSESKSERRNKRKALLELEPLVAKKKAAAAEAEVVDDVLGDDDAAAEAEAKAFWDDALDEEMEPEKRAERETQPLPADTGDGNAASSLVSEYPKRTKEKIQELVKVQRWWCPESSVAGYVHHELEMFLDHVQSVKTRLVKGARFPPYVHEIIELVDTALLKERGTYQYLPYFVKSWERAAEIDPSLVTTIGKVQIALAKHAASSHTPFDPKQHLVAELRPMLTESPLYKSFEAAFVAARMQELKQDRAKPKAAKAETIKKLLMRDLADDSVKKELLFGDKWFCDGPIGAKITYLIQCRERFDYLGAWCGDGHVMHELLPWATGQWGSVTLQKFISQTKMLAQNKVQHEAVGCLLAKSFLAEWETFSSYGDIGIRIFGELAVRKLGLRSIDDAPKAEAALPKTIDQGVALSKLAMKYFKRFKEEAGPDTHLHKLATFIKPDQNPTNKLDGASEMVASSQEHVATPGESETTFVVGQTVTTLAGLEKEKYHEKRAIIKKIQGKSRIYVDMLEGPTKGTDAGRNKAFAFAMIRAMNVTPSAGSKSSEVVPPAGTKSEALADTLLGKGK